MANGNLHESSGSATFFTLREEGWGVTYTSKSLARTVGLVKDPVAADNFAGNDVRFSPEFEALERELAKVHSLHEHTPVDWSMVQQQSEVLLRDQSRDLRVAAWLTWALYQRESFSGLLAGVGLLHHLCVQHWAQIHPRKLRTRAAAVSWLVSRLNDALNENIPVKEQLPLFQRLLDLLMALECSLASHLGDEVPLLLPLCRRLSRMVERAGIHSPDPGPIAAAVAHVKQMAAQLVDSQTPIENEKDAHKALRAQQDSARVLCAWWLKQNATDVRALRLNRTLTWMAIDAVPERNGEQITPVRGLAKDRLNTFNERFERGQFADVLVELESSLSKAPFWFDGQRLVWRCLEALNAERAMREVELHMALLLQRLPGLETLRFSDGQPFADEQTRAWFVTHVMPHVQDDVPQSEAPGTEQPAWELALEHAQEVALSQGFKPAVQSLKSGLAQAQGGRVRFFWQLALARLCLANRKYEIAQTQLDMLDQLLQRSGLQAWEPDLVLEVLSLWRRCCELLPQSHDVRERKDELYRRLCHLDLEVVLE